MLYQSVLPLKGPEFYDQSILPCLRTLTPSEHDSAEIKSHQVVFFSLQNQMSNVESVTVCVASTNGMTSTEKSKNSRSINSSWEIDDWSILTSNFCRGKCNNMLLRSQQWCALFLLVQSKGVPLNSR